MTMNTAALAPPHPPDRRRRFLAAGGTLVGATMARLVVATSPGAVADGLPCHATRRRRLEEATR